MLVRRPERSGAGIALTMAGQRLGAGADPSDPRLRILRRFRAFAMFWIVILFVTFAASGFVLQYEHLSLSQAGPAFALLAGCIAIGAVWHAAAILALSHAGLLDEKRRGPWGRG